MIRREGYASMGSSGALSGQRLRIGRYKTSKIRPLASFSHISGSYVYPFDLNTAVRRMVSAKTKHMCCVAWQRRR